MEASRSFFIVNKKLLVKFIEFFGGAGEVSGEKVFSTFLIVNFEFEFLIVNFYSEIIN